MKDFFFEKTLIIGCGLIGGSFAKALKKFAISKEIFAFDPDVESVSLAKKQQIIDQFYVLDESVKQFDLIVIACAISNYQEIFNKISEHLSSKNLVIDLGSLKDFSGKLKKIPSNFIPLHPICGSEKTGFANSDGNLFLQKKIIICQSQSNQKDIEKITEVIKILKSELEFMDAKTHDKIYCLVSHLPQFLSFLTSQFSLKNSENEFLKKCFRLDNSSYEIWKDVFSFNEKNLQFFYEEFYDHLEETFSKPLSYNHQDSQELVKKLKIPLLEVNEDLILNDNFAKIFFRFLIVLNYLKISTIPNCLSYGASGFKDFTAIVSIVKIDPKKIDKFWQNNFKKINQYFLEIS